MSEDRTLRVAVKDKRTTTRPLPPRTDRQKLVLLDYHLPPQGRNEEQGRSPRPKPPYYDNQREPSTSGRNKQEHRIRTAKGGPKVRKQSTRPLRRHRRPPFKPQARPYASQPQSSSTNPTAYSNSQPTAVVKRSTSTHHAKEEENPSSTNREP